MSEPPSEEKKDRNWRRIGLISGGVFLVIITAFWLWLPSYGLNTAKRFLRWKFDDIHHITTAELAAQMKSENPPAILDIRNSEEYETSHLQNARHVSPESSDAQVQTHLLSIPENRPIVVYCSVGYRSSSMALRLIKLGRTNVSNLEGSIFAWASEGRSLEPHNVVHPYNWFGRRMLQP